MLRSGARLGRRVRYAPRFSVLLPLTYFAALIAWGVWDFVKGDPVSVLYQVLTLAYLAALGAMYLLPGRTTARSQGDVWDRWIALASANLLIPLSLLPQKDLLPYPVVMGALLAANALSWWGLLTLRSSFSLTPEARRLVTSGPYQFVRHPLYLAGLMVGLVLLAGAWSLPALALFTLYAVATLLRARAEERVLRRAFPDDYEQYARATPAYLPRLRGPRSSAPQRPPLSGPHPPTPSPIGMGEGEPR